MNQMNQSQDDEIDLFELFQMLWDGKWLISAFVVVITLLGFGYSQFAQPKYEVSVPFSVNIYSLSSQQICGGNVVCIEAGTTKGLTALLEGDWSKDQQSLSLKTTNPLGVDDYQADFVRVNRLLTHEVYDEAATELSLIKTEFSDALLSTERVANNVLIGKRIIQSIDDGKNVISFGSVYVSKISPKVPLIIALSLVLGGVLGTFFILVRSAVSKRRKQLAEA